jgi:hypothetical protein
MSPQVLGFMEAKLREEVLNRRTGIVNFLQQRQMTTSDIDIGISKSVNEIFTSLVAYVINDKRKEIEPQDIKEVVSMLFKLCLYSVPFWFGR